MKCAHCHLDSYSGALAKERRDRELNALHEEAEVRDIDYTSKDSGSEEDWGVLVLLGDNEGSTATKKDTDDSSCSCQDYVAIAFVGERTWVLHS